MSTTGNRSHRPSPFQGVLNLPTSPTAVGFAAEHPSERYLMHALAFGVALCAVLYVYFVVASVLNITARKDALRQSAVIESSIGMLEETHFALSRDINPESAGRLGLAPVGSASYVYRPGTVGIASSDRNEI